MKHNFSKVTSGNRANFFLEGDLYFSRYLDLINSARDSIHLQTYIFEMDTFGTLVHQALREASERGVKVHLLIDSVGSKNFSAKNETDLIVNKNVYFHRFNGLNYKWFYQWGRRLHHKILLIDHEKAIVGGINVTTSGYGHDNVHQQLDFAVELEGPIIYELSHYCQYVFRKACQKNISMGFVNSKSLTNKECPHLVDLKVSINDWVYKRKEITQEYSVLTKVAKKQITIINSYFFPRKKFMKQLAQAAKRGVKVRLILPKFSDWPSYILASQYLYSYFLKNGVEIYQWRKSILHGKLATVDEKFSTIGSYNLNYTSYQQNLEMNIDILSEKFTHNLNEAIETIIEVGCEKIDIKDFLEKTTWRIKFLRFFFYVVASTIANFSISLIYQEDNNHQGVNKYYSLIRIVAAVVFLFIGIIGVLLPVIPGIPFLLISFLLVYKQLLFNKEINY